MTREEQCVFGLSMQEDGSSIAVIGVTDAAAEYMRDGKTHTFDLTRLGYPVKIMLFGARDQRAAIDLMGQGSEAAGFPMRDMRDQDFSIKPVKP